jgi:excisionase family DNA binding protein
MNKKVSQTNESSNAVFTSGEIAELLHVHINTVRRWTEKGILKAHRVGTRGDRIVSQQHIDQFLKGNHSI